MSGRFIGSLVGISCGTVFLLVNRGGTPAPLPLLALVVAALGILAFVLAAVRAARARTSAPLAPDHRDGQWLRSRGYLALLAAEVVVLFGGLQVLTRVLHHGDAGVAWVATVVGAHFVPLGILARERAFVALAAVMAPLGIAGLVLAFTHQPLWEVKAVAGLLSGVAMVAASLTGVSPRRAAR